MTFPTIQFKATNVHLDGKWQDQVIHKFKSLEKFFGSQTDISCSVEFEKITAHQSGSVCRVEANVYANGKMFRAESTEHSFEHAIDVVQKDIERELGKAHAKHDTLVKRGRRKIKEMLRFGR